jgi:hypothetical protein
MPSLINEDDPDHNKYVGVAWSTIDDVHHTFRLMDASMKNVNFIQGFVENTLRHHRRQLLEGH